MSSAVPYREDLQDETEWLNTGQRKRLTFPPEKTLSQMENAGKVNGTLGVLISSGRLHTYSGFLARHLADGETEAQGGSSTCVNSCNESVAHLEPEDGDLCIPFPLSDHIARARSCTRHCRGWYITSKRGKDAPSALVLEGLAASLIHSLQLHCWKRVQKEDQATRKQPQYLILLDLAGRLLWLYICSFLTKGTGVSFFSSLYLFYGSPVNFSLYYQNWRETLPDGHVEARPTSDWTQKPPCHMSLSRMPWTFSYREKKNKGKRKWCFQLQLYIFI